MIFGRKKKAAVPASPDSADPTQEPDEETDREPDPAADEDADAEVRDDSEDEDDVSEDEDDSDEDDDWDEDPAEWRSEGPFDLDEVDLDGDEVERMDLGALIITPEEGMQLQIVADAETRQGMALVAVLGASAIQVEVRAAPNSGGFAKEIRGDIEAETKEAGGTCDVARGPFGIELRRVVAATDQEGNEGFAPLRDWFAEGPRWLLIGRLMGEAALDVNGEGAALVMEEFFGNLIVRRGSEAMGAGQTVPITIPQG